MVVVGGFALAAFDLFVSLLTKIGPIQGILELIKDNGGDTLIRNSAIYLLVIGNVMLFIVTFDRKLNDVNLMKLSQSRFLLIYCTT